MTTETALATEEAEENVPAIDTPEKTSISFEPQITDAPSGQETPDESAKKTADKDATGKADDSEKKPATETAGKSDTSEKEKTDDAEKTAETEKKAGEKTDTETPGKNKISAKDRINQLTREKYDWIKRAKKAEAETAELKKEQPKDPDELTPAKAHGPDKPRIEDFENYEAYIETLGSWSASKTLAENAEKSAQDTEEDKRDQREAGLLARIDVFKESHPDFEKLVFDKDLKISPAMKEACMNTEHSAELLYYLGRHPDEAARIAVLSPFATAMELGKIEAGLKIETPPDDPVEKKDEGADKKTTKKISDAPEPIELVGGAGVINKDPGEMTNEEYRRWRTRKKG